MTPLPKTLLAIATGVALSGAALAQTDDFDGGANPNGWTFGVIPSDVIESTGGNPAGWLHNSMVDSFAPIVTSDAPATSNFVGDLRAKGVTRISCDAITHGATFTAAGRQFSILLRDTKGTANVNDDDYAYYAGALVPQIGQGWGSYDFDIPSQSTAAVPAGWSGGWAGDGQAFRPGVEWSDVIESVDVVEFWWQSPDLFAIFQQWDVGVDNIAVETSGLGTNYCTPGVANSTGLPAQMSASGSDVLTNNDLTLTATDLPPQSFGFFITSMTTGNSQGPASQGILCLGGSIGRYVADIWNSGATGEASVTIDLNAMPTPNGFVPAQMGQTWHFQAWYRDANPTATSNFTDGLSVTLL